MIIKARTVDIIEEDKFLREISNKIKVLVIQFARFLQGKITKIFFNCFKVLLNYIIILMTLFSSIIFTLYLALVSFY